MYPLFASVKKIPADILSDSQSSQPYTITVAIVIPSITRYSYCSKYTGLQYRAVATNGVRKLQYLQFPIPLIIIIIIIIISGRHSCRGVVDSAVHANSVDLVLTTLQY